ncbi:MULTISPECIES: amidohydrolase [unclassified Bosea (in: a-proteobacteria)]|uniref:amidohydrolase n=2 Tax=unclassified Bosea (in: a-proteobacteria) TaxID=2653178 RepID=UPI00135721A0|nr:MULTISPECIES: amidohydrolase [unclassified Bosea (in: a-proteobacteria)]
MAETILYNGVIRTMDAANPVAEALAVSGGRIVRLGTQTEVMALRTEATDLVDLGGRMLMPGLIDFHVHLLSSMIARLHTTALDTADDFDTILGKIEAACARQDGRDWVVAGAYGARALGRMREPGALAALDAVSRGRPVAMQHLSGHGYFANSAALRIAGIDAATPNPPDGEIVKDAAGQPTGLLIESGAWPVTDAIPELTAAGKAEAARASIAYLNSLGITGFADASASLEALQFYRALDDAGALTCWAAFHLALSPTCSGYAADEVKVMREQRRELCGPHMNADFAKIFLDGVPSLRTAAMLAPYASAPDEPPVATSLTLDELTEAIADFDGDGLGVKVHAVGDRAIRMVLDAVEQVRRRNGPDGPQHQIAHGQFITAADIPRLAELNVLHDMCPPLWHPNSASLTHERMVGAERYATVWPVRDILAAGAAVVAASDWRTIAPDLDPWEAMCGLVTRRDPTGRHEGVHAPDQAVSITEVLPLYTTNPAAAMRLGHRTGRLAPGLSADMVMLDRDLMTIEPLAIAQTKVLATWFEGRLVHGSA